MPTGVRATTSFGLEGRPQDRSRLPALNVLVNNAGIMLRENLLDPAELPVAEDHVATNLLGPIRIRCATWPR